MGGFACLRSNLRSIISNEGGDGKEIVKRIFRAKKVFNKRKRHYSLRRTLVYIFKEECDVRPERYQRQNKNENRCVIEKP